ncbi:MIP/aquaporin family protein [Urbifossiella limnaea]|uniref:Glycerol uptake facilitator protein n=1 Tax=Urbifossiella limnaea TaxID=2528023 RepID=A0A517XR73_9BACT|nr:MIP/aquaporin family protein [Urbifossiella limnaea]QDU20001.1 Glycerol uptake facilitator protein [Urbifossiella limnaea]
MNPVLGEFLGTAVLVVLGDGVVAGVLLTKSKAKDAGWVAVTAGWAVAVLAGVLTARAVGAEGYVNPVGPFVAALTGSLSVASAVQFAAAEVAGAFVGAVIVWLHYLPHWAATPDPGVKLAVFATGPAVRLPAANLLSEAIATFVLVLVGSAIGRVFVGHADAAAPLGAALVWGIGLSLGGTTGYAINPARDLGPRLAHALLPIPGKGPSDWGYAWVPVVGPLLGGGIGAMVAKAVFAPS